ncbi:hypothetical protein BIY24_14450 [Halobacteriovorax marinus]|uniref:hypothetical protein n=1 Tax=Halobacteriovorax marinus TaxID=97084 RepID=UPI000BC35B84|nr:hypothetical protein [Halobacteriovorax marinus]ATH09100.1 hypothetical protein BIY24_14450 [Halobacteriovorax marinus]
MKKVKTILFTLVMILVVFGVIVAILRWKSLERTKKLEREVQVIERVLDTSKKISQKWEEGATSSEWKDIGKYCPDLQLKDIVDISYSKCNSEFLNCYLENNSSLGIIKNSKGKYYSVLSRQNSLEENISAFSLRVQVKLDDSVYNIDLEDTCRDTYLPRKSYGYKTKTSPKRKFDWTWDNFNRNIYVDKFLVTNREVNEWIETLGLNIEKKFPLERPSVFLSLDEMKKYCAFKGKSLASAQVVEAASFYPSGSSDKAGRTLIRYDYPWTRRSGDSFLFKMKRDSDLPLTKFDCEKAYVQDCFEVTPFISHMTKSSSWSGIFQVMGGPFEAYENSLEPKENLRASSFYFPAQSSVHMLGEKLYWDGVAHLDKNIDWKKEKPSGVDGRSLEIGFRCMRNMYE